MPRRKTHEEFVAEVKELVDNEYTVLGTYVNSQTRVKIKHNKCSYEYEVQPNNFLNGNRCPKCKGRIKNKTTDYFKKEVFELVGNNYELLSEYVKSNLKVNMRHKKCGYEYKVTPSDFLQGRRCPKCAGRTRNTESFKQEVHDLTNGEFELIGEFKNVKTKTTIKHNKCGYNFEIVPSSFLNGTRCSNCFGNAKKTTKQFEHEVFSLVGKEYIILQEYKGANKKILMKHSKCEHKFEMAPRNFLQGQRCPKCNGKFKKTTNQFKKEVFDLVGDEYEVIGKYVSSNDKIKIKHNKCNKVYDVTPGHFLYGNRCIYCKNDNIGIKNSKSNESFIEEVYKMVGDEYSVLESYKRSQTKIKIKHNKCGYVYEVMPNNFLKGRRCPLCSESKGEQRIRKFLINNNIKFTSQKEFKGLTGVGGGLLSYDFYLPDQNLLIEYQGEFHDGKRNKYVRENLEKQQEHDKRKREYAKLHGIALLEIWYWDFDNIENILEKELSNLILQTIQ